MQEKLVNTMNIYLEVFKNKNMLLADVGLFVLAFGIASLLQIYVFPGMNLLFLIACLFFALLFMHYATMLIHAFFYKEEKRNEVLSVLSYR